MRDFAKYWSPKGKPGTSHPAILSAAPVTLQAPDRDAVASTILPFSRSITLTFDWAWEGRNLTFPLQWLLSLVSMQELWHMTVPGNDGTYQMLKLTLPARKGHSTNRTSMVSRHPFHSYSHPHSKVCINYFSKTAISINANVKMQKVLQVQWKGD